MLRRFLPLQTLAFLLLATPALRGADQYFDSNGVKIRYLVKGRGEPVLLIHGFTANIEMQWDLPGIMTALAKKYQVIAFDNRGHGKSGKPHDVNKYGMEMVEDAVRLLNHLKIRQAHVVGYSMGAMLTNKLIVTHPERVLSATLGGAAGLREGGYLKLFDGLADSLAQGKGLGPLIVALTPPGRPKPTTEQLQFINKFVMVSNDPKALAAVVRGWKSLVITEDQLKANRVPTLAIVGADDPLKKGVDQLQGRLSALEKTVVIDGADHITAPARAEFRLNLEKFLQKHQQK